MDHADSGPGYHQPSLKLSLWVCTSVALVPGNSSLHREGLQGWVSCWAAASYPACVPFTCFLSTYCVLDTVLRAINTTEIRTLVELASDPKPGDGSRFFLDLLNYPNC